MGFPAAAEEGVEARGGGRGRRRERRSDKAPTNKICRRAPLA